jgi:hypothetical protein
VPWRAVHADHLSRDAPELDVLVLPNLAAMSDAQCAAVRRFVEAGGGLVATGETSLYDEEGRRRADFALADLLGAHATGEHRGSFAGPAPSPWASGEGHSYLRLAAGDRPTALEGFGDSDILPFGGRLEIVRAAAGGRVACLPADLDRCFGRDRIPDHGRLIANLVRWASRRRMPLEVEGSGLLDVNLYRQPGRLVLHVVNLTNPAAFRPYATELYPVGPLRVRVAMPLDFTPTRARRLVAGGEIPCAKAGEWLELMLDSVPDHEVVVLE